MRIQLIALLIVTFCLSGCKNRKSEELLSDYNIRWTTPCKDVTGSMPVGGGNIQLNAWSEAGDILFYLGSTDSYLDNGYTLGKLGRVRLSFYPNPFGNTFSQELQLKESEVVFTGDNGFKLTLWVDVFNPVVHVEMNSDIPLEIKAGYETWRFNQEYRDNKILFYHRNLSTNVVLENMIKDQKAESFRDKITDPIVDLTSGGLIYADHFVPSVADSGIYMGTPYKTLRIKSEKPLQAMDLRVAVRIEQDRSLEQWCGQLNQLADRTRGTKEPDRLKSLDWWDDFWDRSYIHINPSMDASVAGTADIHSDSVAAAWQVGRNYQLFRYMLGCSRGARHPVLFNGGIFNFDNENGKLPEYRNWQECEFMAQNQRLVYWPLLKTGDNDIMQPVMNMYRNLVDLQKARAQYYWGLEGVAYPEGLNIYGLHSVYQDPEIMVDCFNRCPSRKRTEYGHSGYIHLEHHYTSMLDFAYMLLEAARFGKESLQNQLPMIENAVKYYDNYYRRSRLQRKGAELDEKGKLELYPSSALELYAGAKNPTDVVSGLQALVKGVLSFPRNELTDEQYNYFREVSACLPDFPTAGKDGYTVYPPAESWELEGDQHNMEFPQLYVLFPFESVSFEDTKGLKIAENTWLHNSKASAQKNYICWFQGGIYTAHLGLTQEAKNYAMNKFLHPDGPGGDPQVKKMRFPVFWANPGFCHCPDMDHGGSAMVGLQDMLMQTPEDKIYLCPAWPADWECDFKLHAPYNTIVQGKIAGGKLSELEVIPASRKKDVIVMNGFR
nr:DUF5703 domain-containing protein [Parabacteroides goldsteinii]